VKDKASVLASKKSAQMGWPQAYWREDFAAGCFRVSVIPFERPKQPFYYIKDLQMGCNARTESGVEIHEVDLDHMEILHVPHVRVFGQELAECIAGLSRRAIYARAMQESSQSSVLITSIRQSQ